MTVLSRLLGLGTLENLWNDNWPGWAYPPRKTELALIGNGTDAGNVVIQESAKGYREGTLVFTVAGTTDRDTARGYEESGGAVTFTDYDGSTCSVEILAYSADALGADLYRITLQLIQLSEPVAPGS